tara:strand:- start:376 stop:1272 length:897 start_codon:yes stop_codon:yes gene_type:complete
MEILVVILQLFSSHTKNYSAMEPKYSLLSVFLFNYPFFDDQNLKTLILKTLEFVCTGVSDSSPATSLNNLSSTYASMCQAMLDTLTSSPNPLTESNTDAVDVFLYDITSVSETLIKLLEFDSNFGKLMCDCGLVEFKLNNLLCLITAATRAAQGNNNDISVPIISEISSSVSQILRLILTHNASASTTFQQLQFGALLVPAITDLSKQALQDALGVFEEVALSANIHISVNIDTSSNTNTNTRSLIPSSPINPRRSTLSTFNNTDNATSGNNNNDNPIPGESQNQIFGGERAKRSSEP